jgi:hypothetical protein
MHGMDNLPAFEAFPSIARLSRQCVISEKIDGTNSQVCVLEDGRVIAGSRSRWLTLENDNYGFARWVAEHEEELRTGLGVGRHFGEWWGSGIQRRYGLKEKRFSLFNSSRWVDGVRPECCHVVPVLYSGIFSSTAVDDVLAKLAAEGSCAAPGFMDPEGVVVYVVAAKAMFKKTLKGDEHKGQKDASVA